MLPNSPITKAPRKETTSDRSKILKGETGRQYSGSNDFLSEAHLMLSEWHISSGKELTNLLAKKLQTHPIHAITTITGICFVQMGCKFQRLRKKENMGTSRIDQ
jgi:hypothetical protein